MLELFNTFTRQKEPFKPINKGKAGIYTCGPTVYDYAHIGNLRAYVCADILVRYLEFLGFKVTHVMNITDVDDKTIKGARKEGVPLSQYTDRYKNAFFEDLRTLNIRKAEFYPEATKTIKEMVELIKTLMEKGFAYRGEDSSIYFSVKKFNDYGRLANIKTGELQAGARVKQDEYEKEQANDFALWKAWDEDDGDVFWETEIGRGRPGWHIECSAMSMKHLGPAFDIHTGGEDLIFPHHQNEIAQSEAATGKKFVNYWMHNAFLLVDGKKMSKSLGNFYTLRDLLKKGLDAKAIRFLLLSAHYRTPLNFTEEGVRAAGSSVQRFMEFMEKMAELKEKSGAEDSAEIKNMIEKAEESFRKSMDDDLNISEALGSLFEFVRETNRLALENKISRRNAEEIEAFMLKIDSVLGVMEAEKDEVPEEVLNLVKEREIAREAKDFRKSDEIRDKIKGLGFELKDTPEGTRVRKV